RFDDRLQQGVGAVALGRDAAPFAVVEQHAREPHRPVLVVHFDPPAGDDPVVLPVGTPHPVVAAVAAAARERLVYRGRHALLVFRVDGLEQHLQRQPFADGVRIQAEAVRETLVGDEAVVGDGPDPGTDDRAGVESQLHSFGGQRRVAEITPHQSSLVLRRSLGESAYATTRASAPREATSRSRPPRYNGSPADTEPGMADTRELEARFWKHLNDDRVVMLGGEGIPPR